MKKLTWPNLLDVWTPYFPTIYVCRMHKSIYDLRRAPRALFDKFTFKLLELGFIGSQADTSLFICRENESITYHLIYMDDIILTSSNFSYLRHLIH